ncbi:MAG: ZIP family metal transporter [Ignavibacteriales bacterium]
MNPILIIVIISVIGPIIGSLIGVLKKPSETFIFNLLSFAAGAMLSISFLELIPESIKLSSVNGCIIGIVIGLVVCYCLDKFIPHIHQDFSQEQGCSLEKTSVFLLLGMFIHHFPEGMAMGVGSISDIHMSFSIALAIAIHDIPEGISTSAPLFHCNGNRFKSFLFSSLTALPTLIGFAVSYFFFQNMPFQFLGVIIAATAGFMIYICTDELIPASSFKLSNHSTIFSFMSGVILVIFLGMNH